MGDSRMAQYSNTTISNDAKHFISWANTQLGHRLNVILNTATTGFRSDQYLASLSTVIASGAKFLVIWGTYNDISQGFTATQAWTGVGMPLAGPGIKNAMLTAIASGMTVILVGEPGGTALTAAQSGQVAQYNQYCREFVEANPSALYFDLPSTYLDPTSTTPAFKAGYSADGLHPIILGGYNIGLSFANLMSPIVNAFSQEQQSAWDIPANGGVNLLTNPLFLTATGGTAGTGASGSVPAGWTLAGQAQVSVVGSNAAGPYGNDFIATLTASSAGYTQIFFTVPMTNILAGDIYQSGVEYTVASGSSNFTPPEHHQVLQLDSIVTQPGDMFNNASYTNGPTVAYTNVLQTAKFTVPTFTTKNAWFWELTFTFTAAGSATVNVRRPWLRKRFS